MAQNHYTQDITLTPEDNRRLACLCGPLDENLHFIENRLQVTIRNRSHLFSITGIHKEKIENACKTIEKLYEQTKNLKPIKLNDIHISLKNHDNPVKKHTEENIILHTKMGNIHSRTKNQTQYLQNIFSHDVNFGIGPAGTGKTYLAVACAVDALKKDLVERLILVRPAVEAGERLGFLPGDLAQKVDPYLRPIYDALYAMLGFEYVDRLLNKNIIEIAPLAYMRGRTLNDAFIILDEAQNTTVEQMKMFLTRIGFGSKAVITGDITQIDLKKEQRSGLKHVINVLHNVNNISFTYFDSSDVVRHPVVQKIINAYEDDEKKQDNHE